MAEWPSLWGSDIHVCNQPSKCWWRQSGIEAGLRRGNSTGRSRVNLAHITLASVTLVRISSRGNLFVRSGVDDFRHCRPQNLEHPEKAAGHRFGMT